MIFNKNNISGLPKYICNDYSDEIFTTKLQYKISIFLRLKRMKEEPKTYAHFPKKRNVQKNIQNSVSNLSYELRLKILVETIRLVFH